VRRAGPRTGRPHRAARGAASDATETFPVVVGEYGFVSLAVMPCSRHTRSNSTSAGRGLVNRPVNCFTLSVSTSAAPRTAASRR
jgi:hypothetical protein